VPAPSTTHHELRGSSSTTTAIATAARRLKRVIDKPPILLIICLVILPIYELALHHRPFVIELVLMVMIPMAAVSLAGGWRYGLALSAPAAVAWTVATAVSGQPLAAALFAGLLAFACKVAICDGRGGLVPMVAMFITMSIIDPPTLHGITNPHAWANLRAVFLWSLFASLWAVLVGAAARRGRPAPSMPKPPLRWGLAAGVLLAIVVGPATAVVVSNHLGHGGAWMLVAIYVVFLPLTPSPWIKAFHRAIGTLLGVGIVWLLTSTLPAHAPAWAFLIPGVIALIAAIQIQLLHTWAYWMYCSFLTAAIVLLEGSLALSLNTHRSVQSIDGLRLRYELIGIAVALVAQAVVVTIQGPILARATPGHRTDTIPTT
jgi:hypothetical protein